MIVQAVLTPLSGTGVPREPVAAIGVASIGPSMTLLAAARVVAAVVALLLIRYAAPA